MQNGLPLEIRSDQGPCYGDQFTEWYSTMGIRHCHSDAYNSQINGAAEKGVGQIKTLLSKMGRKGMMNQEELNKLVFKINSHQTSGQGSALERFFGRSVRTYQPELVKKKINHQQLIAARAEMQKKTAEKLGRRSRMTSKLETRWFVKT